jgi:bifunctional UDP-N-acetylglucosamine pyrophosphorylase/glucosamine-1-phosphate N-acetyltransferase
MNSPEGHCCNTLNTAALIRHKFVVYGHGGDSVPANQCMQQPQLGTGHAVQQASAHLNGDHVTLVLYGDVPLIRAETLLPLIQICRKMRQP